MEELKLKRIKWSAQEMTDFARIVEGEWENDFPGYQWAADRLNDFHKNNRSSKACRAMDRKIHEDFSREKWASIRKEAVDNPSYMF